MYKYQQLSRRRFFGIVWVMVFVLSWGGAVAQVATHAVISEFMADNETVLADGDGDFSDWIEIYNPTGSAINLNGYYLTDDAADLTKWQFPSTSLASGGRVIVFASGKAPAGPAAELHTNFKLSKGGEYLALVAPDGITVLHAFAPSFPEQTGDISYGILGGNVAQVQFMAVPTPGNVNDNTLPAPGPVAFSLPSQTFTGSISVALTSGTQGATIYYTTDGSQPSSTHGAMYSTAISIGSTTHLRAVAVLAGQTGAVSGASYIRLAADLANYQADIPLLVIDNFGGGTIPAKGWSSNGAGVQQVARQSATWAVFDRDPSTGMAALSDAPQMISRLGIRGRGAYSSTWSQKPYSVEVWDEAEDERDVQVLDMPAHSDWVLYYPDTDGNKDPVMMFNTFIYALSQNMGRYAPRFRWVEAFVNEDGGDLSLSDRRGVYAIMEKVSRSSNRLDFKKLSDDGTEGGFLVGINRMDSIPVGGFPTSNGATSPQHFHTKGPNRVVQTSPNSDGGGDDIPRQGNAYINFDNPSGYRISSIQRTAIENWFVQFEDVLYNNSLWLDPVNGYRRYLDAEDFVDYFIFNNLSRNGDGMLISMFPWVGDDGKLRMGPTWDYNWSSYYVSGGATGTQWHRSDRLWYGRLFSDPDFTQLYIDRWFMHRDGALSNSGIAAIVDGQAAEIGQDRAIRQGWANAAAWTNEQNRFKDWLTTRANWYDGLFTARPVFTTAPGDVASGTRATFSPAPSGSIYYTTDGTDPRIAGGTIATGAQLYDGSALFTTLVGAGASARALVPTVNNPGAGTGWTATSFDDSQWTSGTIGVGYDRETTFSSEINLDLRSAMDGVNSSAYIRIDFQVTDPSIYDVLNLKMKYDDGFVAYINGHKVTGSNDPSSLPWNASASAYNTDTAALQFQLFNISHHLDKLVAGNNTLAIHGLNQNPSSSDFLIVPQLEAGQSTSAAGIPLTSSTLITARTLSGSNWSAPAKGYFFVNTVAANASNLLISEIHYRPRDASPSEVAAGFTDRDDFEFIELMNVGSQTINLTGVKFVRVGDEGIEFDFSNVYPRTLAAGQRALLVKNRDAFVLRYGSSLSSQIAGEYSGNLSNDGELLTLKAADDSVIQAITYNDNAPWPEEADGDGFSLVLVCPESHPDTSVASHWRVSRVLDGNPGGTDAIAYTGGDLVEYAVQAPLVFSFVDATHINIQYALNLGADDATVQLLGSTDMNSWSPYTPSQVQKVYRDGKIEWSGIIDSTAQTQFFLKLSVTEK